MKSRLFDSGTHLRDEVIRTKAILQRPSLLDTSSDANSLLRNQDSRPVRFLRSFRMFGSGDLSSFARALCSKNLSPAEVENLALGAAYAAAGAHTDLDFVKYIFESNSVPSDRFDLVAGLTESFNFFDQFKRFQLSREFFDLSNGSLGKLLHLLTTYQFRRQIDRIILVGSAIDAFDRTLELLDSTPFPLSIGGKPSTEFFVSAYSPTLSRLGSLVSEGWSNLEPDLLELLESRFDPNLLVRLRPPVSQKPLPFFDDSQSPLPEGWSLEQIGYRSVAFTEPSSSVPQVALPNKFMAFLICMGFTLASGAWAVPHPLVVRFVMEEMAKSEKSNKSDEDPN